jgi:hypothetical protein
MFLKCGHPADCERTDAEGEATCAWCDEVAALRQDNQSLRAAIEGRAVVCRGGELTVEGPIGYLAVYAGTVNCVPLEVAHG